MQTDKKLGQSEKSEYFCYTFSWPSFRYLNRRSGGHFFYTKDHSFHGQLSGEDLSRPIRIKLTGFSVRSEFSSYFIVEFPDFILELSYFFGLNSGEGNNLSIGVMLNVLCLSNNWNKFSIWLKSVYFNELQRNYNSLYMANWSHLIKPIGIWKVISAGVVARMLIKELIN